jgi:hypothetical protein
MKEILSITAVVLTFIAYIPYYRDVLNRKTHPHIYSWGLWCFLTILIVALQILGGAGPSTWVTAAAGVMCLGVILLGLKHSKKDITISDKIVAVLALVAIGFWVIVDQPVVSIVLVVIADLLAFWPTVRKSWKAPHTETLSLYATNTIRYTLAILAIEQYSVLSTLWPLAMVISNGMFAVMLSFRRRTVRN